MVNSFVCPFIYCVVFGVCFLNTSSIAQGTFSESKKNPFYIDLNSSRPDKVFDVQLDMLYIQYSDSYGTTNDISLEIYNWKRDVVATVDLQKVYGINHFNIPLNSFYNNWEMNKIYLCELKDESGRKYQLPIRPVFPPDKVDPLIDIIVNPISFDCEKFSGNTVEFYAKIDGGKSPYKANWYVLNNQRTDFLYQPKEESIPKAGYTSVIHVDKNPDYYVMLVVQDACGGIQQKMVHMVCKDKDKAVNSLFVEPLDDAALQHILIR
jgi:hypothetical protein